MSRKTIFVTGGTGFLGAYLLRYLLKQKRGNIRALRRSDSPMQLVADIQQQVEWIEGDLLDTVSLEEAMEGVAEVYHCGAMVSFEAADLRRMNRINIEGTANVVNIALDFDVQKLVHISSIAALGRTKKKQHLDEKARWERNAFNSNYAISKYLSEQEVWRGIAEGLNAAILNPSVILGAGFWDKGTPRLFQQAWNGLRFYPPGSTGFVDVRDVARLAILLMESEQSAQRFIANSSNIDYRTFFTEIAQAFKKRPPALLANSFYGNVGGDWIGYAKN